MYIHSLFNRFFLQPRTKLCILCIYFIIIFFIFRKLCRHCRCSREDHCIMPASIQEKTYSITKSTGSDQHSSSMGNDDDSGCSTEEYAWVPPGLSSEQVGFL